MHHLWKDAYKSLVFYGTQILKDNILVEDIVAEAFIKLWNTKETFSSRLAIRSFLYKTVKNACIDVVRSKDIHHRIHAEIIYGSSTITEEIIDYDQMYAEYITELYKAMTQLPPTVLQIFKLYFFEEMNTNEIALKLNIAPQTVRNQKTKAINLLKSQVLKTKLTILIIRWLIQGDVM